jgi:hypothetical protein
MIVNHSDAGIVLEQSMFHTSFSILPDQKSKSGVGYTLPAHSSHSS